MRIISFISFISFFVRTKNLRPSRPLSCRKRRLCQGQALPGCFANLDMRRHASDGKCSRARDEDASGGGSEQRYSIRRKNKKQKTKGRTSSFLFPGFFLPSCFPHDAAPALTQGKGIRFLEISVSVFYRKAAACFHGMYPSSVIFPRQSRNFTASGLYPPSTPVSLGRMGVVSQLHPARGHLWTPAARRYTSRAKGKIHERQKHGRQVCRKGLAHAPRDPGRKKTSGGIGRRCRPFRLGIRPAKIFRRQAARSQNRRFGLERTAAAGRSAQTQF